MIAYISFLGAIIGAVLSTAIMLYIAMATPMGPWIDTTIALLALLPMKMLIYAVRERVSALVAVVVASGIAGIIATACAFSLPTIGFIDTAFFDALAQYPLYSILLFGGLILSAGLVGLAIAYIVEKQLLDAQKLPFPLGALVYETITAGEGVGKSMQLLAGAAFSGIINSFLAVMPAISRAITRIGGIRMDVAPIYVAVGFIAGPSLILPIFVGVVTRYGIIDPVRAWYVPTLSAEQILLSLFTGIVLYGAAYSIGSALISSMKHKVGIAPVLHALYQYYARHAEMNLLGIGVLMSVGYFWWQDISLLTAMFVVIATFVCCQQLALIAGRMGIAPLGRYATFVMVPALLIFRVSPLHATLIATYVEIAGGVSADALFGLKLARLADETNARVRRYQIIGLVIAALLCGFLMIALINAFGLGSPELFALKARNRAWLITAYSFDWRLIAMGSVFAAFLSGLSINPVLVLGGLAMPADASLMLAAGGALSYAASRPSHWYPLWSGIFAASSLWMIGKALMTLIS